MTHRPFEPPWLSAPSPGLRVWALEPYYGGSHRAFLDGWRDHSSHAVTLHTLPGRHWRWRMHGGAFALAEQAQDAPKDQRPQVLFASDMLDAATYLSLVPGRVRGAPLVAYFHENQLTYPLPAGVERDLGYAVKNLSTAVVADRLLFNSAFHRDEFVRGLEELVALLPDAPPARALREVAEKAEVLPLGVDLRRFDRFRPDHRRETGRWGDRSRGPLILWNQRWEYDKDPAAFFAALYELQAGGVGFRVAVAGPNQGLPSRPFVEARERLDREIVQWGQVTDLAEYADLLWEADVVVSTALHEFFGTAIVEAMYCGCRPVLPRRLSYPELLPAEVHADVLYGPGDLVPMLIRACRESLPWSQEWQRTWVSPYDWGTSAGRYDAVIWSCWEAAGASED